ncbi:PREDICTED: zinc finger CCHC domain-containing protein 8 homolog isoform X2 [Ceratosolen solmsi marchali]|uniref:Zinc finger CCHC domain-containing protein 8 homolog isoform X2 n=1 Tax=Ceratosolen solmsi marchali TaxID=326594 RepID=A0AAJ7DZF3_9HYME|nr:PREDICTED: zinc finger CCHC domain-containing protein 8 homolog isoform X2 [Ceratosolen solmsi marchali]
MSALISSASDEVIPLDDSTEDNNDSVYNLSTLDTTKVHFDGTLPPGVAPDGFVILNEVGDQEQLSTSNDYSKDPQPIFKIFFRDASAFQNYSEQIERFLKELILPKNINRNVKSTTEDLILQIFDSNDNVKHSSYNVSPKYSSKEKQSNNSLFTIDTNPKSRDDLDIPMYRKKFNKTLQKSQDEVNEIKEDCGPKRTCFNCLGNHNLRDCEEPRNYVAINKNRKSYNAKRGPLNVRYHLDENQRFEHFIPGQISLNLRKALGVKENELPRHIYRMRTLGYPPGWLEEARLQHSGLALFNSEGCAEAESDEEGEIICPGDKDKYDIKKIIDFPGFNVIAPYGTREECKQYWGSSMQERYSKAAMLSYLSNKKVDDGYVRKKLPNPANLKVRTDMNPGEMDIDEITEVPPPPPPIPIAGAEDSDCQPCENISMDLNDERLDPPVRTSSPSLVDLENAKNQLLAELDGSQSNINDVVKEVNQPESLEASASNTNLSNTQLSEMESSKSEEFDSNKIEDVNNVTPKSSSRTPSTSGHQSILAIHLGTPILKSTSPYRRLPNSENFSKSISEVINFENLPDSTGKYDQMSELLQKVRTTISELHKEQ